MRLIPWVDVLERDTNFDNAPTVKQSYPFPDVNMAYYHKLIGSDYTRLKGSMPLSTLRGWIDDMDDEILKECYHTRLHFILNRWHPKNFIKVNMKDWKY
ncbi:hypothetical protein UFOVP1655_97 [uncultured Caudovirales phage]|uniref:Uncharacterized protein n=1 Tax=uncultured Caudovirales phage TaxID=2100421 RepID=A0A6J5T3W6_9CAUD|nr:hypothetical protein UFOVP1655_97 [uncultured Caudovirales phage]